jgi:hypothetical protein
MGLLDNIKNKISETVGVDLDTDKIVEATGKVAEVSQNVADTAEAVRDTKDTLSGE